MKFCETCGDEIFTKDGENQCRKCEDAAEETGRKAAAKKARARANRRARESALRACGLVKVRGAMGGIYWE